VQFLATYIMKGRLQAMMVAATLALLSLVFPPISIVSSATVALVTLRLGGKEGLYVLLFGCLAAALLSVFLLGGYQFAIIYGLVLWLPVWLIAIILRAGRNLLVALEIGVVLGILLVIGFYVYEPSPDQFWRGLLTIIIQQMLEAQPDVSTEMLKSSAETFAHYMTGAIAAGSLYGMLLGLFLARFWQSLLFNPGGFRAEFLGLKGHMTLAIVTIALLVLAFFSSGGVAEICWNILMVLLVFYSVIGVAVLHSAFAVTKGSRFTVPFLYITLIGIPHITLLIALCGLSDTWLNLRNKLKINGA